MNLNQLINKSKAGGTPSGQAAGAAKPQQLATQTETAPAAESKPSVPLKVKSPLKLGGATPKPAVPAKAPSAPATGLKLGNLGAAKPAPAAPAIPDDLDLSSLASLDTSEIPATETTGSNAMQFPDEIEATAPVRELPEDLTAQQTQFIESLDTIYSVLHDPDMLGQSIRMVMQELQENPEYTKLISDHDVHTMIKSIRNVMGIAKIRKDEKKTRSPSKKSSASSKFDADTMAQLDAMMANSKAFDDE